MRYSFMRFGVFGVSPRGVPFSIESSSADVWKDGDPDLLAYMVCRGGSRLIVEPDGSWSHDEDLDDALYIDDWFNSDEPAAVDGMEFLFDFYGEGVAT